MDSLAGLLGRQKDIHIQQPIRRKVSHNKDMCRGHMVQITNTQSKYFVDFNSYKAVGVQIFAASHTVVFFLNLPNQFKQNACNIQLIESAFLNRYGSL